MRKNVRYRPLGEPPRITLIYGVGAHQQRFEVDIVDESMTGLGIRVAVPGPLALDQTIQLETSQGPIFATIVRLEPASEGGFNIGLHYLKKA